MHVAWLDRWLTKRPDRTQLGASRPGIRWIPTPGGEVRIREQPGPGPRILIGADLPDVIEHHDRLLETLRGRADVVVYEPPGTGGSLPSPGFSHTWAEHARVVEAVLEATGGPRALVFPCWVGFVAHEVSPDLRQASVLIQTPAWEPMQRWADGVDPRRLVRTPVLGQAMVAWNRRRIVGGWYRASVGPTADGGATVDVARDALHHGGCYCLASLMQALDRSPPGQRPADAHLLWGAADRTHRRTAPPPGALVLEDAGHCAHLEQPDRVVPWLLEVLA